MYFSTMTKVFIKPFLILIVILHIMADVLLNVKFFLDCCNSKNYPKVVSHDFFYVKNKFLLQKVHERKKL